MTHTKLPTTRATTAYGYLTAICQLVLEEPKRLHMGIVCQRGAALHEAAYLRPSCGTVGCVAGWALTLARKVGPDEDNGSDLTGAATLLGLTNPQTYELFMPIDLVHAAGKQTPAHARATVKHIKAFQAKYAAQLKATRITKATPKGAA